MIRLTALTMVAVLVPAGAVLAQDQPRVSPEVLKQLRAACSADIKKLCDGVQPGGGRIAACLKQNEAQVSTGCKNAVAKARQNKAPPGSNAPQGSPQG